ncbi:uncharacterized protein LOC109842530 [Asparagus officinalis]|uniref:uncharacterized protein LOC109842530 n=1 Tax=Asparagus officinalis TaxID=4686 RepID=UPI00098E7EF2|nr:uncharacterized protein LOC109842530 [Asparagus officinalis]
MTETGKNPMEGIIKKLNPEEISTLMQLMKLSAGESSRKPQPKKVELPPIDIKLDGPATYLSWSRRVKYTIAGRSLEGYLKGEKIEPAEDSAGRDEWKSTHMLVYIWLLNSVVQPIAATVDVLGRVHDVWEKLRRTYDGVGNNLRVFQIEKEINATVQGERTVQEYATELERLWLDHDHFSSLASCKDPGCKEREASLQKRTMLFLQGLAPAYEQRTALLLTQTKIPSLEEAVSAMIQEEIRIRLQAGTGELTGEKSALVVSNPDNTRFRGETRKCFNCGEIGHLRQMCPKPPRERNWGERGQAGGRGRGRGGRRGRRGGHRANLTVAEREEEAEMIFTDEDRALLAALRRKQRAVGDVSEESSTTFTGVDYANYALSAHPNEGRSTAWIIDSGASRHVTGNSSEFLSYTHLAEAESIQIADGTSQNVVGKGTVSCTCSITLSNVLHAPSFPVSLLSISAIIIQLNCIVSFDIPKVIF